MNPFKKYKLRFILVFTTSMLILILIAVQGIASYASASNLISRKISNASLEALVQINNLINERMNAIQKIALSVVINNEIQQILINDTNADYYQQIRDSQRVSDILANTTNSREDISEIAIYTDRMDIYNYSTPNGLKEKSRIFNEYWTKYAQNRGEGVIPTRENDVRSDTSNKYIISYIRKFPDYNGKDLGVVCVNLDEGSIRSIIQGSYTQGNLLFITDEEGNIISPYYGNDAQNMKLIDDINKEEGLKFQDEGYKSMTLEGGKYLIIYTRLNTFGWRVVQLKPYSEITEGISSISRDILLIGLVCFALAMLFLFYFSKSIFTPIKNLVQQMNSVKNNEMEISIDEGYHNEIGELNTNFKLMIFRIKELIAELGKEHQQKCESELKALQSQINPHFLYNTLDSINWMAIKINANDISNMILNLGTLLRLSLNKGRDFIPIKGEIDHIRCYVNIQSVRYNGKFTFKEYYDPGIFNYKTVKLILQPLIENAIVHGFENTKGIGQIVVEGRIIEGNIVFFITDDGCGVDAGLMNESLESDMEMSKGYGVKNVDTRIKMNFGNQYGLRYHVIDKGTKVEIRIPMIV